MTNILIQYAQLKFLYGNEDSNFDNLISNIIEDLNESLTLVNKYDGLEEKKK